jgi:hypothetical protein
MNAEMETKTAATAAETRHDAPSRTKAKNAPARKTKRKPSKKQSTKARKPAAGKKKPAERGATKTETILALVTRARGATLAELMDAAGWQAHSIRGFLSNARKSGVEIDTARNAKGEMVYKAKGAKA